jgi:hypothetical protein
MRSKSRELQFQRVTVIWVASARPNGVCSPVRLLCFPDLHKQAIFLLLELLQTSCERRDVTLVSLLRCRLRLLMAGSRVF